MKTLTILFVVALLALTAIGCTPCQECVEDNGASETLCESEFDTPEQYQSALDNAESNGATCTAQGF